MVTHALKDARITNAKQRGNEPNGRILKNGNGNRPTEPESRAEWAAAPTHTCLVDDLGQVFCWGDNGHGALGVASAQNSEFPLLVVGPANVTQVSAGGDFTCAIGAGELWCWGRNNLGQLGRDTPSNESISMPADL